MIHVVRREDFFTIVSILGKDTFGITQAGTIWVNIVVTEQQVKVLSDHGIAVSNY